MARRRPSGNRALSYSAMRILSAAPYFINALILLNNSSAKDPVILEDNFNSSSNRDANVASLPPFNQSKCFNTSNASSFSNCFNVSRSSSLFNFLSIFKSSRISCNAFTELLICFNLAPRAFSIAVSITNLKLNIKQANKRAIEIATHAHSGSNSKIGFIFDCRVRIRIAQFRDRTGGSKLFRPEPLRPCPSHTKLSTSWKHELPKFCGCQWSSTAGGGARIGRRETPVFRRAMARH